MKKAGSKIVAFALFVAFVAAWVFALLSYKDVSCVFFPGGPHALYALTDEAFGGTSTSEMSLRDSTMEVEINVRSGVAYPAVGMGVNLTSVDNRPAGYFDFSKFDSLEITFATKRMRSVGLRVLTDDPVYSKDGRRETFRPLVVNLPATRSFATQKVPLTGVKTAVWWLAAMGLEEDDGLSYLYRACALEIVNGDGIMRGIPDEIDVKEIRAWGTDRSFVKAMIVVLALVTVAFALVELKLFGALKKRSVKSGRENV